MSNIAEFKIADYIREIFEVDADRINLAKDRQKKLWAGQKPDKPPILFYASLTKEQEKIPNPDYKQAFYDSDAMLCGQMRGFFSAVNSKSDSVPSVRANMGTGNLLSLLGRNQEVFPDKMPWFKEHFTKEEVKKLTPEDIKIQGDFELGLKHMRYFRQVFPEIPVYCMDNQGPFDIAHLILGDELFLEVYDDEQFVHHLMNLVVEMSIRGIKACKDVASEPINEMYHGNALYAENMGIRICEDTSIIVGPDTIDKFVIPYTKKLLDAFGGGWVHYCGYNEYFSDRIRELDNVRGMNYGLIPGKEDIHDEVFEREMEKFAESGKVFYGTWPRRPGESGRDYLRRMHYWAEQGVLLLTGNYALEGENGFSDIKEALDFWYNL